MVVGAFPVAKLGALLLKQISKPIANVVKEQAKSSPVFRKYVCLPPAQLYNWCEEKAKMWVLNLGKPVSVPVYNENMAIELGSNLLGEGIIFIIAAGILIAEYNRSARKEAAKEEAKIQEIEELKMSLKELFIQTEEQATYIRELRRKVGDMDTKMTEEYSSRKDKGTESPPENPPSQTDGSINIGRSGIPVFEKDLNQALIFVNKNIDEKIVGSPNLLFRAINDIQNQFWSLSYQEKRTGILKIGLNNLNSNS